MSHEHPHPHDHPHDHGHHHGELVPPPPDWFQRNWKWAIPLGCGTVVVMGVGFLVGLFALVFGMIKNSDAYAGALERLESHPGAVAALGTPIEPGFFVSGNISVSGPNGSAELAIPVAGPKARGTLYVIATRDAGTWSYERLELQVDGGERIDLLSIAPSGIAV